MRKIFGVLLSVLCICCAAIGLTGCKKDKHIHAFDKQVITDEYKATDATCTEKATYYYSCECGEKGAETFEYGSTTEHNFVNGSCTYCGKKQETSLGLAFTLLDDGTYEVSGIGSCTDTEIVILSVYNDKPVTSIGNYAFKDCKKIINLEIPNNIVKIEEGAFEGCVNLKNIVLPFVGTSRKAQNGYDAVFGFIFGYETVYSSAYTFQFSNDAKSYYYKIPETLQSVTLTDCGDSVVTNAFYNCSMFTEVIIKGTIKHIKSHSFYRCSKLEKVTFSDSVVCIGEHAFDGCSKLSEICDISNVTYIGDYSFSQCSFIDFVIPKGVVNIESGVFNNCKSLSSIVIHKGLVNVSSYAFYWCSNLDTIFYEGTQQQWKRINVSSDSSLGYDYFASAKVYYYSETESQIVGDFWHYNSNGKPEKW